MEASTFAGLNLRTELLDAIDSLDYVSMTPVQAETLPSMLLGKDVLAQANTGSGKTAAFAITLLNKLEEKRYQTQSIVVCPTRELADQVANEIRRLARAIPNVKVLTLCGGKPFGPQLVSLQRAPHIVVGTPGRLLKHLNKRTLNLSGVGSLVLDEADRMLDMGFSEDISRIIGFTPKQRQTLLFSATYPDEIEQVSSEIQVDPVDVRITLEDTTTQIEQIFFEVEKPDRIKTLVHLLRQYQPVSTLIFCNTIEQCDVLAKELLKRGCSASALHGDLEQFKRDQVLVRFSNRSVSVLVATDVAARGIDIKELDAVVNFELSRDPEVHIHRIGRTGRAGSKGLALSLYSKKEVANLRAIENYSREAIRSSASPATFSSGQLIEPVMATLFINAGRKDKIRAGDILGALTSKSELDGDVIGKIDLFDKIAYVAVKREAADRAVEILSKGKIKGRSYKIKRLR